MIYYLTYDDLANEDILYNHIYPNMDDNYYWGNDFSDKFYIKAAKAGFITTAMYQDNEAFLLPEIQFDYAVLHFKDLKISQKVTKVLKKDNYIFEIDSNFDEVLKKINNYHKDSWLIKEYMELLKSVKNNEDKHNNFKLFSTELYCKETKELIAGEIGYKIGSTYTSLTGFSSKNNKFRDWGKVQMILLSKYLLKNNYNFWNLGHPQLQYKIDLGAKIYPRKEFLNLWYDNI